MSAHIDEDPADIRRRMFPLILQVVGASDIVMGAAIALLFPGLVGDHSLDGMLMLIGAVFALMGVGFIWWGRARQAALRTNERTPTVVGAPR